MDEREVIGLIRHRSLTIGTSHSRPTIGTYTFKSTGDQIIPTRAVIQTGTRRTPINYRETKANDDNERDDDVLFRQSTIRPVNTGVELHQGNP